MKYGISILSIVPMRNDSSDKSEMINQVLFGEYFKILEYSEKWSKIELAHDNYQGWICNKQWLEIREETFLRLDKETHTITTDIVDIIKENNSKLIVIGSILPSYKSNHAIIEDKKYFFEGLTTTGFSKKEKIIENALSYINTPYLWGGRTPFGIDCSGLTQILYRLQGINIPRDAYQQAEIGKEIISIKDVKNGDLAFFKEKKRKITHVGVIMDNNKIIHASGKVRIDSINEQGIFNKEINKYTHKLYIIKRIL